MTGKVIHAFPVPAGPRLTVRAAAARLTFTPATVYRMIERGELACLRHPSGCLRIPVAEIERFERSILCPAHASTNPSIDSCGAKAETLGISDGPKKAEARKSAPARKTSRKRKPSHVIIFDDSESQPERSPA